MTWLPENHFSRARGRWEVTISIGLSPSSDFEEYTVDEILIGVDEALYEAKNAGRNCVRSASARRRWKGKHGKERQRA